MDAADEITAETRFQDVPVDRIDEWVRAVFREILREELNNLRNDLNYDLGPPDPYY